MGKLKRDNNRMSLDGFIFSVYFLVAPFEDIFSYSSGTLQKYLAIAIVVIFLLSSIRMSTKYVINEPLILLPLALVAISWASAAWSIDIRISTARNIAYTLLPLLFIIARLKRFSNKEISFIEKAIILSGFSLFVYTMFHYNEFLTNYYGRFTLHKTNDPNNLAAHLILPLFLALGQLFGRDKGQKKLLLVFVASSMLFSLFVTGSRGALLATIAGFVYLMLAGKNVRFGKMLVYVIALATICLVIISFLPDGIINRLFYLESFTGDIGSYGLRSDIWRKAILYLLPDMPLWGYGSGTAGYLMTSIYGYIVGIHNTYLNMILEFGVLGLPLFLGLIYSIYHHVSKSNMRYNLGALIAMLVVIFFLDSYAKKFLWNTLIYYVIAIPIFTDMKKNNVDKLKSSLQ